MSDTQTWTDEQLQQHLEEWDALTIDEQNALAITFTQRANELPWNPCYILSFGDTAIDLTYMQALTVEAWLQEQTQSHMGEILRRKAEEIVRKSVNFHPTPDGTASLCPKCGKLYSYQLPDAVSQEVSVFILDVLHKHLNFCQCGKKIFMSDTQPAPDGKILPGWLMTMLHDYNVRGAKASLSAYMHLLEDMESIERTGAAQGSTWSVPPLPEPTPKHDGWLDDTSSSWMGTKVEYDAWNNGKHISIHGGHGLIESTDITLDAKQALSLLAWLEQEKATLERLAKDGGCYVCGHDVATEIGKCSKCGRFVCEEHGDLYRGSGWTCRSCHRQMTSEDEA